MADVAETRFEVELQDSAGLLSKQAGSPYIRDRKMLDGSSKPRVSIEQPTDGLFSPDKRDGAAGGGLSPRRGKPMGDRTTCGTFRGQ
ncbi:hypothetical protein IscW_ISCW016592 [Ixodes scapularis]|uniref:Uncharacterized protein n=1 Tax=Ixodes scapularis TaxID=6945 RepID=B7PCQ9_IXOSC|nr:hypothetical protein IscW_ISCW016592 [Ixodes scapularis]|eukprot:XP_002410133.1 hypothetical protein IscW_ISCW016592 [Ixodes scapularis]